MNESTFYPWSVHTTPRLKSVLNMIIYITVNLQMKQRMTTRPVLEAARVTLVISTKTHSMMGPAYV